MNSLVGYGSSDESDSEPESLQPTAHKASTAITNGTIIVPKPQTVTRISTTISASPPSDSLDKKLDISDDEDNYIPKSSKPALTKTVAPVAPAAPTIPQIQNLAEVIDKAQIVTVECANLQSKEGVIASFLPKPKQSTVHELELERLHKSKRRKKDRKKIFALDLEDFSDEEETKPKPARPVTAKSASGLFSILPEPKNCKITTKSTKSVIPDKAKLMRPRTLRPPPDKPKISTTPVVEDNNETEQNGLDFFSFGSSKKSAKEIAQAAKAVKLDQFKPKHVTSTPATITVQGELKSIDAITSPQEQTFVEPEPEGPLEDLQEVPTEFRDFHFNAAEIVDVNQEIQSTDEWALKNLDYSDDKPGSSGKCPMKGQTKRKNQINYLAWQAKEREIDLKKQWGDNRMNRHATQSKYGFRTEDVMEHVVWNESIADVCGKPQADPYFCTRYVTLSLIAGFTGILCIGKVAKYHYNKVKCAYQLSIFYCALAECICFVLHWTFLPYDITENMGYWFRVIQLLIVCFVYSKLASNVLNREEAYRRWYLPILGVFALYYAALIPWMFTIPKYKYPHKCTEFFHVCYTALDFILSQVFLVCGVYLTRKMALVNMPSEQFLEQKKQLWGVILAFETEAIISIVYDILLHVIGAEEHGCGGFLYQHNAISVIAFVFIRSLRLFVAVWLMLYMFDAQSTDYSEPTPYVYDSEDSLDAYMAARSQSIVPYNPEGLFDDARAPLITENTFENYLADDGNVRFGERTNRLLIEASSANSGNNNTYKE